MEFPFLGKQCSENQCKLLDFLPVECSFCNLSFCANHSSPISHQCSKFESSEKLEKKTIDVFKCSSEGCKSGDPVEMSCVECRKHYCIFHRHHGCLEGIKVTKKEQRIACKEQFKQVKAETDKMVQETLRNAKNRTLANKIKLMKIKGNSVGDSRIPLNDRIFFAVAPPLQESKESIARNIFVSKTSTLGKAIDTFSKRLKVTNKNDEPDSPKLMLFTCNGALISDDMSILMENLLTTGILVDGDSLILEYVQQENINQNNYNIIDENRCVKYVFV